MRAFRYALFGVLALTVAGCNQPLTVDNTNNPDRDKALASVTDLENFLSTTYAVMHSGTLGGGGGSFGLQPQLLTQGMENVSGLANFAMGPVSAIPRNQLSNFPGAHDVDQRAGAHSGAGHPVRALVQGTLPRRRSAHSY